MPDSLSTLDEQDAEIVLGIVAATGTDIDAYLASLQDHVKKFGCSPNVVRLSGFLERFELGIEFDDSTEYSRITSRMDAGNKARNEAGRGDFLALCAVAEISQHRIRDGESALLPRTVHIVNSLKHPSEVEALKRIYGPGFFLVGVHSSERDRRKYFLDRKNMSKREANDLITRDQSETDPLGQQVARTFHLSDVFVSASADADTQKNQTWRFLDLVFADPHHSPTRDEHAMFMAYAASLRSASLSRQVGAVVVDPRGNILATGCNDVPKYRGGQYETGEDDRRDHREGYDSNERERNRILEEIVGKLRPDLSQGDRLQVGLKELSDCRIMDLTEFGRDVHAEMEALLHCARVGVSVQDATLYTTTFPCHNCAKHVVGSGIGKVVYIEPYPKSRAVELHGDAIRLPPDETGVEPSEFVQFVHFLGIGPRRYFDLFSMRLGDGIPLRRKHEGSKIDWERETARPRNPLLPTSYIQREQLAVREIDATMNRIQAQKGTE